MKSTKYQVTVDTVLHLLQRDDAPKPVSNKDGAIEFPALPDLPEGAPVPGQMRKGVIYAEFTSMVPLLQQVSIIRIPVPGFVFHVCRRFFESMALKLLHSMGI